MTKEIIRNEDLRRLRQKAQEVIEASRATVTASQVIRKGRHTLEISELEAMREHRMSSTPEIKSESA